MGYVTRQMVEGGIPADRVEVYMQRFGGVVVVRELTSVQVAMAAKVAVAQIASSEGTLEVPDPVRRQAVQIALALVDGATGEPLFGDKLEDVLASVGTIESLPWRDHMLLVEVLNRLTDGRLSEDDRKFLAQEHTTIEQLDFLRLDGREAPAVVAQLAEEQGDAEVVYSVALRVPEVIFGRVPMSVVRSLHKQMLADEDRLARKIAEAQLELAAAALGASPEEG